MSKDKDKNPKKRQKPRVHPELEGFEFTIDSFGELKSSFDIERINEFLNRQVDDKKLKERDDYDELKNGDEPSKKKKKKGEGD